PSRPRSSPSRTSASPTSTTCWPPTATSSPSWRTRRSSEVSDAIRHQRESAMPVKTEAAPADALGAIIHSRNIVDLSVIVDQFYPAFQPESQEFLMVSTHVPGPGPLGYRGPMYETIMIHDDHTGTHCDAPAHQVPPVESGLPNAGPMGKVTVEQLDPSHMMGPACVID